MSIALLGTDCDATRIIYDALERKFGNVRIILEPAVPKTQLLQRRLKKLGLVTVFGQVLFMVTVLPFLRRSAQLRVRQILDEHGLKLAELPEDVVRVSSVNSAAARDALRQIAPQVVVVSGTRIVGRETLQSVSVPFINMHAGITPLYRGVHGGYWALAEGRRDLAGTTIHLVDEGIDTGSVIAQASFVAADEDSFVTLPYLHLAAGLPLLLKAVEHAVQNSLVLSAAPALPSKLRTHPTLWRYLSIRLMKGVR